MPNNNSFIKYSLKYEHVWLNVHNPVHDMATKTNTCICCKIITFKHMWHKDDSSSQLVGFLI